MKARRFAVHSIVDAYPKGLPCCGTAGSASVFIVLTNTT
jgi:hypothetical protein